MTNSSYNLNQDANRISATGLNAIIKQIGVFINVITYALINFIKSMLRMFLGK